jgi:nucleoside-diphosphate-sugar epimerase
MDFTPAEIAAEIQKTLPEFAMSYEPDFRQAIADQWPQRVDDHRARKDWGWNPRFDLAATCKIMLDSLSAI